MNLLNVLNVLFLLSSSAEQCRAVLSCAELCRAVLYCSGIESSESLSGAVGHRRRESAVRMLSIEHRLNTNPI